MKYFYLLILSIFFLGNGKIDAQTMSVSVSPAYTSTTFVSLSDGTTTTVALDSWDLAFTVSGQQDVGVSLNEGANLGGSPLSLYLSPETDFSTTITESSLTEDNKIQNDESGWDTGALNLVKDPSNQLDFGWGTYNPGTFTVNGTRIFVLEKRDGSYIKFMIESLPPSGIYTIKYANLDGTNEQTTTVDKNSFPNTDLAFFSFETGTTITTPDSWDVLFTRYNTLVPDMSGVLTPYTVTGILSGYGVEAAKITGAVPANMTKDVFYETYNGELSTDIDVVGSDWKSYQGSWVINSDYVYFVKTATDDIYRLNFIGFEGSSTGVTIMDRVLLTNTTNVTNTIETVDAFTVFPNPVQDITQVSFNSTENQELLINIYSIDGKVLQSKQSVAQIGENVIPMNLTGYATGQYILYVTSKSGQISTVIEKL